MPDRIDKHGFEPAYAQLAAILRRQIGAGVYHPGEKIPSESSISRQYGLSLMTVRQAIGLLTEKGLVERVQGSGTFVKPLTLTESRFDLDSIREIFQDPDRSQVKVLEISLSRADARTAEMLRIHKGERIILICRVLLRDSQPVLFHEGRIRYDPTRPVVEAELNLGPLSDLFNGQAGSSAKKGQLTVLPAVLSEKEAARLNKPLGTPVFRLEYLIYDFNDIPFGWGWFTVAPDTMTLRANLGLWD